ncbi:phospholipase D-like domain-containing protein [Variovorax boronicumulans]|uniref:hypothetical protein n=1 Tax=Variovorax boronicumulans TaxID=436515 RepID=UPI001112D5C1|nr:hypothetical protein [Variovorax boronicumulans]
MREVLLPPDGYRLESALGTAYSLDAETLVTIPLFAAGLGAEDLQKSVGIAKVYDLGARLTLLVQGDRIGISRRWATSRPLLKLVGDAVVPCSIKDGSFHPKLLVLVFDPIEKTDKRLFRIVVATRNLTTDNSWDSVVVLDEAPNGVRIPGLAEAVSGLAQFVNNPSHAAVKRCTELGGALRNTCFQPLQGVTDLELRLFHRGSRNAEEVLKKIKGDDLLIISPFVRQGLLDQIAAQAGVGKAHRWLVTRPVDVPDSAFMNYQVFKIADAAVPVRNLSDAEDAQGAQGRLVGLHAKIYLASSKNGGTRIVVTSANATPSGWTRNVEVAVTGVAKAKALQVPTLLTQGGPDEERTFRNLLDELTPMAVESETPDPEWVRRARSVLAGAVAVGRVRKGPPRILGVTLDFQADRFDWPQGVEITMHPFGYSDCCIRLLLANTRMSGDLGIEPGIELTPFAVLTLRCADDPPLEIVLAMQLQGDLDWLRDDARATLAQLARPDLYRELLWYFGVKGHGGGSKNDPAVKSSPAKKPASAPSLPILEKVLLRVHGPNAKAEIATIDSLLAGLGDDAEDERLATMWRLVKESLR